MSTRSRAASKSSECTTFSPRRTANSAASFTRFERSAPDIPGVPRATTLTSTSGEIFLSRKCTVRIATRSSWVGSGTMIMPVEAARAEQRGVEDVGPVGGRHHHDALGGLEAVHLREHLVERLLALVVAAAEARAALAADGVDLVDEDDRGRLLARGLEQVTHARGADTDEHLHEVGAGDRHERHAGFTRHRARDERLAGAGRADEQHALGDARADLLELPGVLQEVDDLVDLLLHRAVAGDVAERRLRLLGVVDLGAAAADVHDRAHLALRAPAEPDEQAEDQQQRQHPQQDVGEEVAARVDVLEVDLVLGEQLAHRRRQVVLRARARELVAAVHRFAVLAVDRAGGLVVLDALHVAGGDGLRELRVREVVRGRAGVGERADEERRRDAARARPRAPSAATATSPTACRRCHRGRSFRSIARAGDCSRRDASRVAAWAGDRSGRGVRSRQARFRAEDRMDLTVGGSWNCPNSLVATAPCYGPEVPERTPGRLSGSLASRRTGSFAGPARCRPLCSSLRFVHQGPSTRPRVRWGLWDFAIAWGCGLVGSIVAATIVFGARKPLQLIVLLVAQNAAVIAYLVWVGRAKGVGSLFANFGFTVRLADAAWFLVGVGLQLVSLIPTAAPGRGARRIGQAGRREDRRPGARHRDPADHPGGGRARPDHRGAAVPRAAAPEPAAAEWIRAWRCSCRR